MTSPKYGYEYTNTGWQLKPGFFLDSNGDVQLIPPKPPTAPPGYYIDNYGNVLPVPTAPKPITPYPEPYYPPAPTPEPTYPKAETPEPTYPRGYTVDDNGNLKLMPGYYDNGSGMGQPIPPAYPPNFPPSEVFPSNVEKDITSQPKLSNPQNLQTDDIRAFVNANIGDPATIASAMQQYGLNATDVAQAMGVDPSVVTSYLGYGTSPQPDTSITPTQSTETPPTYLTPPTPTYLTPPTPITPPTPTPTYLKPPIPIYPTFDDPQLFEGRVRTFQDEIPPQPEGRVRTPQEFEGPVRTPQEIEGRPNYDMSQLATLPDGSQVYTGQ
jgi:hypothetical protein